MQIKRYTKKFYSSLEEAKAEAIKSGELRIVAETVDGVYIGTEQELGGCISGMYRTYCHPTGRITSTRWS